MKDWENPELDLDHRHAAWTWEGSPRHDFKPYSDSVTPAESQICWYCGLRQDNKKAHN